MLTVVCINSESGWWWGGLEGLMEAGGKESMEAGVMGEV